MTETTLPDLLKRLKEEQPWTTSRYSVVFLDYVLIARDNEEAQYVATKHNTTVARLLACVEALEWAWPDMPEETIVEITNILAAALDQKP